MTAKSGYLYSVIRVVPEPVTGEFINVAVLVTDHAGTDWALRRAATLARAERIAPPHVIAAVEQHLRGLAARTEAPGEEGLSALHRDHRNIVQYSNPLPIATVSAAAGADFALSQLVKEA